MCGCGWGVSGWCEGRVCVCEECVGGVCEGRGSHITRSVTHNTVFSLVVFQISEICHLILTDVALTTVH